MSKAYDVVMSDPSLLHEKSDHVLGRSLGGNEEERF